MKLDTSVGQPVRLAYGGHPDYSAAWNPRDGRWSIRFGDRRRKGPDSAVIAIPTLENRDGDIEARFMVLAPNLGEDEAAIFAANAILDFLWDDDLDDEAWVPTVVRVVMVGEASGARYAFDPPARATIGPPVALPELQAMPAWSELGDLGQAVLAGAAASNADPEGRLQASCRHRIWWALGSADRVPPSAAHRCRAFLALFCGAKVLWIWESRWPHRREARALLEAGLRSLSTDAPGLERDAGRLWVDSADLQDRFGPSPACEAGFAIARAAHVVRHDETFGADDASAVDPLPDPQTWDAAYLAAEAHAATHPPEARAEARRAFWRFYLEDALPRALQAGGWDLAR